MAGRTLKNDRLLRALRRQPVDTTPVWIMRQAGRYLPEYRETRRRAGSFLALCKTPELACEVTLQPLARYPLDAAILFSDILTVPDAMGLGLQFQEGEGPRFERPLREESDLARLRIPDPERELGYVMEAIRLVRRELAGAVPLIGFSGSPWTLATYMIEGGSSREFARTKRLVYTHPGFLQRLLAILSDSVAEYLNAQIAAGVDAVMIFDTWGGLLASNAYRGFSLDPLERSIAQISHRDAVPIILYTKGGGMWLEAMSRCGCDALGLDWTVDLGEARARVGQRVALQGNLDPDVLFASPETIRSAVSEALAQYGSGTGHVFNLGHGIAPEVNPDHLGVLVEAVHESAKPYHLTDSGS
jgi:uroporphyrinogen decarboxylase